MGNSFSHFACNTYTVMIVSLKLVCSLLRFPAYMFDLVYDNRYNGKDVSFMFFFGFESSTVCSFYCLMINSSLIAFNCW